jgi:anti-sigma B factor antagonist
MLHLFDRWIALKIELIKHSIPAFECWEIGGLAGGGKRMEIQESNAEGIHTIIVSGRIDAVTSKDLDGVLKKSLEECNIKIVVSLAGSEYISSAGLRVLLDALKKLRQRDGDLKLASLQPMVREVFEITGFTKLFYIYQSEAEAVSSFRP